MIYETLAGLKFDIKCKYKHNDDNDPFVHFSIPAIYGFQDDNLEDKIINCTTIW